MFQPFTTPQDLTLGDLTIQSDEDEVSLHGQTAWTRDRKSLARLQHLIAALKNIEAVISATPDLPGTANIAAPRPAQTVDNPFTT